MVQAKPRQDRLLHQAIERLLHAARRQIAKEPDAGVGVLAMGTRRVGWGPLAVVGLHLLERIHLLGELQRQAARAVGSQLPHGDVVKGGSLEPGGEQTRLVIELEAPLHHGVGPQRRGQGLAHGTYLEQGLLADTDCALPIGHTVVEIVGLAILEHGHRHARDPVLLEQRPDAGIHHGAQGIGRRLVTGMSQTGPHQGGQSAPQDGLSLLHSMSPDCR